MSESSEKMSSNVNERPIEKTEADFDIEARLNGVETFDDLYHAFLDLKETLIKVKSELDSKNAELEKALEGSFVDKLTGCYNRRFFENFKEDKVDPNHDDGKFTLVFADVNDVKRTNDDPNLGYGHGDKLIKDTADFLKSKFRKEDHVIRLGGDEFVVICVNDQNDPDFEERVRDRMNEAISTSPTSFAYGIVTYDVIEDYKPEIEADKRGLENTKNRAGKVMHENKNGMKAVK